MPFVEKDAVSTALLLIVVLLFCCAAVLAAQNLAKNTKKVFFTKCYHAVQPPSTTRFAPVM
jgi:hypothetical protein